jgi:hypothetical protein
VSWVDVFAVLVVCHLVGDFLAQTEWQALNKFGGLGGPPGARRALVAHVTTYTLCFVPAFIWLRGSLHWGALGFAALIAVPHLIQDDGRLLSAYMARVKHSAARPGDLVFVGADQSLHVLALFGTALLAAA